MLLLVGTKGSNIIGAAHAAEHTAAAYWNFKAGQ